MTMQLSEAAARATLLSGIWIVIDQSAKAGSLLFGALHCFARQAAPLASLQPVSTLSQWAALAVTSLLRVAGACGWLLTRP